MQKRPTKGRLTKLHTVILAFAQEIGRPIHKTKLVKLVYLLDNLFYEHVGRTLTGLEYVWDNYGPNAVSNAIVREADNLVNRTRLHAKDTVSMYGTAARTYRAFPLTPSVQDLPLDPTEWEFIGKITKQYGALGVSAIVAASKATTPFQGTTQYQRLEMKQREDLAEFRKKLEATPGYLESLDEDVKIILAGEKAGHWKTLEEIEEERAAKR